MAGASHYFIIAQARRGWLVLLVYAAYLCTTFTDICKMHARACCYFINGERVTHGGACTGSCQSAESESLMCQDVGHILILKLCWWWQQLHLRWLYITHLLRSCLVKLPYFLSEYRQATICIYSACRIIWCVCVPYVGEGPQPVARHAFQKRRKFQQWIQVRLEAYNILWGGRAGFVWLYCRICAYVVAAVQGWFITYVVIVMHAVML